MIDIFDKKLTYYCNGNDYIIVGSECIEKDKIKECWNTFAIRFFNDLFSGAFYAQDGFLQEDINATIKLLLEQLNKPLENLTISWLGYINKIQENPHYKHIYKNAMSYFDEAEGFQRLPQQSFKDIMKLLNYDSFQDFVREKLHKKGLAYVSKVVV